MLLYYEAGICTQLSSIPGYFAANLTQIGGMGGPWQRLDPLIFHEFRTTAARWGGALSVIFQDPVVWEIDLKVVTVKLPG